MRRYAVLDASRGVAVLLMMVFHFCYDLNIFRFTEFNFYYSAFWLAARAFILGSFVLIAGMSFALAHQHGVVWGNFAKRTGVLLLCALLVSVGTHWVFSQSWVFFGVLHFMCLASVLGLLCLRLGIWNMVLGGVLILIGTFVRVHFFDASAWQWFGLMTYKPVTEDYVPLLPWFGVFLVGIGSMRSLMTMPLFQQAFANRAWSPLLWLGKRSLMVYMLHQPLFFAGFYTLFWLRSW